METTLHHLGACDGTTSLWNHNPPHRLSCGQHAPPVTPTFNVGWSRGHARLTNIFLDNRLFDANAFCV